MAAAIPALIGGAVSLYSAKKGRKAQKKATAAQQGYTQQAIDTQNQLYGQAQSANNALYGQATGAVNSILSPYAQAGQQGLGALQSFVDQGAKFSDTPAFKDIVNTQRAGGQGQSGNTLTALGNYYGSIFRPQRLNELGYLPRIGAQAAGQQAGIMGNLYSGQANSNANLFGAQASAVGSLQAAQGGTAAGGIFGQNNVNQQLINTGGFLAQGLYNAFQNRGGTPGFGDGINSGSNGSYYDTQIGD
jgi:hypothetical protein